MNSWTTLIVKYKVKITDIDGPGDRRTSQREMSYDIIYMWEKWYKWTYWHPQTSKADLCLPEGECKGEE